ncbi:hypothetical protein Aab01nite_31480 [Paractinoplanes abujensis]|uniref:Lipoprotein n=1 Tax=Paractinoplanes abujensis TaxID=882441 RepID=A0A7W7G6V2_9ACTN|nr:hypothetical protein [Actinoplanes abujensis]MBB4697959.1 hypothetical protein [Actinoplanes abujensis]GID19558.1 hypothetical protein Aab01nite_31480 [Actinoplanes abujensis]
MPRRTIAAAVAALALIPAGCGGNDEPTTPKAGLQATLTRTDTQLSWQWTLTNDDSTPIVILDGPVTGTTDLPQLWITPGDGDTVQVAYRFLAPPEGVDVAQPILQTGHTIAAGATASGTAQVTLPLDVRHPYAGTFDPPLSLPDGDPSIRFCVGVVSSADVTPQPGGAYAHLESAVAKQRLLCSKQ